MVDRYSAGAHWQIGLCRTDGFFQTKRIVAVYLRCQTGRSDELQCSFQILPNHPDLATYPMADNLRWTPEHIKSRLYSSAAIFVIFIFVNTDYRFNTTVSGPPRNRTDGLGTTRRKDDCLSPTVESHPTAPPYPFDSHWRSAITTAVEMIVIMK